MQLIANDESENPAGHTNITKATMKSTKRNHEINLKQSIKYKFSFQYLIFPFISDQPPLPLLISMSSLSQSIITTYQQLNNQEIWIYKDINAKVPTVSGDFRRRRRLHHCDLPLTNI